MTSRGSSARHRGRAEPEPERAWLAAVADGTAAAAGTPFVLLGQYLIGLADAAVSGRRPQKREHQRYLFDAALVFNVILTWDAIIVFDWTRPLGVGLGRFVLLGHPAVALHGVVSRLPSRGRCAHQPRINHFAKAISDGDAYGRVALRICCTDPTHAAQAAGSGQRCPAGACPTRRADKNRGPESAGLLSS